MISRPLYAHLAALVIARNNCHKNAERHMPQVVDDGQDITVQHWTDMARQHENRANTLVSNYCPSGSGWDRATELDWDASTPNHLVFVGSFHHMNDGGMYDGWTDHTIHARPSLFDGIDLRITGTNRNEIKDYLHDLFSDALKREVSL